MTKRSEYKLSPRIKPFQQSVAALEGLRAHPLYGEGELIEEAAEAAFTLHAVAAGQNRRRSVSRAAQHTTHLAIAGQIAGYEMPVPPDVSSTRNQDSSPGNLLVESQTGSEVMA